ncbi:MAG: sulfur oxidation c-type cytochrome SoxX, partial [Proteobacteria bacterium]|nr:sulfur oxidation c-type cytochrome SoxX [Pseudomonadota bacterium]
MKFTKALSLFLLTPALFAAGGSTRPSAESVQSVMRSSFVAHGQAGLDRLDQDATQKACSQAEPPSANVATALADANRKLIVYPADGKYLGDWKRGEAIAEEGTGLQYSDDPAKPNGGNCYACHQMAASEIAYGTIGPSLQNYGKRGTADPVLKLAWGMLYDMKSVNACSAMPRFGAKHILTEQQLKDVMAYLFDPASPVNH